MGSCSGVIEATVHVEEVKDVEALFVALKPESGQGKRFMSHIEKGESHLNIHITAEDPTAMRAALNSYLRLLSLIDALEEAI